MRKKILSIVLAIMMVLSVMPLATFSVFAAKTAKPVANCEKVTVAGYDYAVKYSIADKGSEEYYNDWVADIVITADKDVAEGAVTLRGAYGSYDESHPVCAMKANEGVSLLKLMNLNVTYWDLVNSVKEFTCGVVNEALTEDVNFTIKVVLSDGTTTFDVDGSVMTQKVDALVKPVAKCEDVTVAGYDYAVKYSIATAGSDKFNDWDADIVITPDKDVATGAVTLKGAYGSYDESYPCVAMKGGESVSLMKLMGYDVQYWDLVNSVKEFTCGVVNNSLAKDTNFAIKVVLSNGTESFDVAGSVVTKTVAATDVKPVAKFEKVTAAGYDKAVKYSIAAEGSDNYNDWDADIVIIADKDVAAGAVTLTGEYGSLKESYPVCAMKAGEPVSVLEVMGLSVTYADLVDVVKEFTCGVTNVALDEDTNFTIKVVLSKDSESFDVDGSEAEIVAETPEVYNVTVNGGASMSKVLNPAKSAKYEIATVKIAESDGIKDGNWFVYWVDQDGNIVSTYSTYSFFVVEDRTLTPVYVSPDVYETERAKAVLVTDIVRADNNGNGTATLFSEHSASKVAVGGEISQHGIIWTTDASQSGNLTIDNDTVNKSVAAKTNKALTGLFRTVVNAEESNAVYARSYVVDANGNAAYGEVKTVNLTLNTSDFDSEIITCSSFDSMLVQADEIIPTADDVPAQEETETSPIVSLITSIINAIMALIQAIIALF